MNKFGCFGIAFALALFCFPASAVSLKIDKLKIEETVAPGDTSEGVINIINSEEKVLNVQVGLLDFYFDSAKQQVHTRPFNTQEQSCAPWIQVSDKSLQLPPKTSHALQYLVRVPEEAALEHAEYYAVIYIETFLSTPDLTGKLVLASKARMLVTVRVRIEGKVKLGGEITEFRAVRLKDEDVFQVIYRFKNTGNALNKVTGSYSIIDAEGNLYGRGTLVYAHAKPGKSVVMGTKWDGELDTGEYDFIGELRFEPDRVEIREYRLIVE